MKLHLVDDCKAWWRYWSSRLAILFGGLITLVWNDPTIFLTMANMLPAEARALLSPLVFLLFAGLPILVRMMKQPKLNKDAGDEQ